MAARGLGKGLDSLIPKAISEPSKQEKEEKKSRNHGENYNGGTEWRTAKKEL